MQNSARYKFLRLHPARTFTVRQLKKKKGKYYHNESKNCLFREALENIEPEIKNKTRLAKVDTISRRKIKSVSPEKSVSKSITKKSAMTCTNSEEVLTKPCSYFPVYTLHAVNCILNLKIRKSYGEHELKGYDFIT